MSRRDHGSGTPSNASNRQNEYFIPRDGIDREVITADICRYLGNDALVRPGTYEDKKTGRVIQGYFVTAYRNLTSAMIADLKADSARWEQERRNHSGARYSDSQNRFSGAGFSQYDTSRTPFSSGPSRDSYGTVPRYPGSDAPGYSASNGSQPYHQDNRQSGYGTQYQQPAYPPGAPDTRYASTMGVPPGSAYGQSYPGHSAAAPVPAGPYYSGSNMLVANPTQQQSPDPYQGGRVDSRSAYPGSSSAYGGPSQPYYSPNADPYGNPRPQPIDPTFGRTAYGSTTQAEILGSAPSQAPIYDSQYDPQPQYENQTPPPSRPAASSSSQAQTGHSGSSHSRRSDRERDRDDRRNRR